MLANSPLCETENVVSSVNPRVYAVCSATRQASRYLGLPWLSVRRPVGTSALSVESAHLLLMQIHVAGSVAPNDIWKARPARASMYGFPIHRQPVHPMSRGQCAKPDTHFAYIGWSPCNGSAQPVICPSHKFLKPLATALCMCEPQQVLPAPVHLYQEVSDLLAHFGHWTEQQLPHHHATLPEKCQTVAAAL